MEKQATIANLWRNAVAEQRDTPAYLHEVDGEWQPVTWAEAGRTVDELANGLLALGVEKGDSFGLLARTSLEWALFDFALALVGAIGAPIYASSSRHDVRYLLENSGRRRRPRRGRGAAREGRGLGRQARAHVRRPRQPPRERP